MKPHFLIAAALISSESFAATPHEISELVIKDLGNKIDARKVVFSDKSDIRYTIEIYYLSGKPVLHQKAKADTELAVRTTLKRLSADNKAPSTSNTVIVRAIAYEAKKGELRDHIIRVGSSTYDFNNDKIVYQASIK